VRYGFAVVSLVAASLAALPSAATVNHGDFPGTGVDFLQVSETTQTAGDPEPIWGAPTLAVTGTQLLFTPPAFLSTCTAGGNDTTASELTTTIASQSGVHIEVLQLQEAGDAVLTSFPPFGTAATNASAAMSGTVTVIEDISGPITPVVIPFTGTFTPSGSFALPTNFGASSWTGNINVDIASAVPNATKVVVSLSNTLVTHCAPGGTSATIQKKAVSGPAVALAVNPQECELEVDKTCCVTQPVLPDLDSCDGKLERLILEYTGDGCGSCNNNQGGQLFCHGRRSLGDGADIHVLTPGVTATPSQDLEIGDVVELTSTGGLFGSKTKLKVSDGWWRRQYLKVDTSCERAIACGDQLGAFKVVGIESTLGGVVDCNAPPPPPTCAPTGDPVGTPCNDKVVDMVFEYNGQACQSPLPNPQSGFAKCSGNATGASNVGIVYTGPYGYKQTVLPSSGINNGDRIRVTSTVAGSGLNGLQSFKITDSSGVRQKIDMKVSCDKPFKLGDEFGSLKVVEFTTKSGQHVALGGDPGPFQSCEVPLAPPGPHCTSDLSSLSLVYIGNYLGAGCTVSNGQGGLGTCSGVADPGDPVSVTVPGFLTADPPDQIEFGDIVTITPNQADQLNYVTNLTVAGAGGSQAIQIKTSCTKPLNLGDRFGSFVVFGMDREDDGAISLGGNVQYQYKVTNPGDTAVGNVSLTDDQLGTIASGVSLAPGASQTFTKDATLFGTTTNVATANGDATGSVCTPGTDQLTVNVTAPPPGSFYCSEPIKELTLIWNGAQTVNVRAWSGVENYTTLLDGFDDVAPGDAITVSGLSAAMFPTFEIFNTSGAKIGESTFDLWCNDPAMNAVEDCGKNVGNLKFDFPYLNNDWLLEGMVDSNETLACTPGLVPQPPSCGFGPELMLVMPGLFWLYRRRLKQQA
jgi:uncharacterized repeat protein (TIGR01451 family)